LYLNDLTKSKSGKLYTTASRIPGDGGRSSSLSIAVTGDLISKRKQRQDWILKQIIEDGRKVGNPALRQI
jgi:hypothetical protein